MKDSGSTRLKILYLPRWYPNKYDPMPGLFIERHGRSVSPYSDIAVLYVHPDHKMTGKGYEFDYQEDNEIKQLKIYYRTARGTAGKIVNVFRYLKAHNKGFRYLKGKFGTPDIIHVNVLTRLGLIALKHKIFKGIPYVITEHWTRYLHMTDTYSGWLRKICTRIVVKRASAVLPVTRNLKEAMESYGLRNSNYRIIPNVVDMEVFQPSDISLTPDKTVIVHVSCFEDKQKNISGLLCTLKKLSQERTDWHINMIGDGIHFEQLKEYSKNIDLDEKLITFHGLKEGTGLVSLMQDAHFQVMFSRFENLPVVILESYACGVPVLSTDVGGIAEHMNNDLGMLIKSEDEAGLYSAMIEMMNRKENFSKKTIRTYALNHFSKEVIGKQLFEIYHEIGSTPK